MLLSHRLVGRHGTNSCLFFSPFLCFAFGFGFREDAGEVGGGGGGEREGVPLALALFGEGGVGEVVFSEVFSSLSSLGWGI